MKNVQNILFDMDGTLMDSAPSIVGSLVYMLEQMHVAVPPVLNLTKYVGPPLVENIKDLVGPDCLDEGLYHYRHRYNTQKMCVLENKVYDGIKEILEDLCAAGKTLFVATSKHIDPTLLIVEHFKLKPYFKGVHGSRDGGHLADKGELLAMILHDEKLDPSSTIMIGDRLFDVVGAKKNGLPCIGAGWGYGCEAELKEAGAAAYASSPAELSSLLLGSS